MKNGLTYIVVTLLALLIFYGGAGVNFISYCCSDCRSAGVEVITNDICCDIHEHHHDHNHATTVAEDDLAHLCEPNCCSLERMDFEWDQTINPFFKLQPVEVDLLSLGIPILSLLPDLELTENLSLEQDGPPLIVCPRVYLSLLTTLLI